MRLFAGLVAFFATLVLGLPLLEAQVVPKVELKADFSDPKGPRLGINFVQKDEKKDEKKPAEKAPEAKKGDEKKDDPKVDPKVDPKETKTDPKDKVDPKKIVRADEGVVMASPKHLVKIKDVKTEQKEIVIIYIEPKLQEEYVKWEFGQAQALGQAKLKNQLSQEMINKYNTEKATKLNERFAGDVKTIVVTEIVRIRSDNLFPQLDSNGKPKKISEADKSKLRNPRLPGYIADFSNIHNGQLAEIYVVKQSPVKKVDPPAKTPKFIGADPTLNITTPDASKVEVHMIVLKNPPEKQ